MVDSLKEPLSNMTDEFKDGQNPFTVTKIMRNKPVATKCRFWFTISFIIYELTYFYEISVNMSVINWQ
jgi:hypothetical protein